MLGVFDVDGHVRESLGLYVLGDLQGELADEVETHLAGCGTCRLELRDLQGVTIALAFLSAEEAEELTGIGPADGVRESAPQPGPESRVGDRVRPSRLGAAVRRLRPSALRGLGLTPARLAAAAAAAAVVSIGIGFAVGIAVRGGEGDPNAVPVAAASANDRLTGVSMSVNAYEHDGKVSINASIQGLQPNQTYFLFVVTKDGTAHLVRQWSTANGAETFDADVDATVSALAYFTVVRADGTVVMLAWCQPLTPPTS